MLHKMLLFTDEPQVDEPDKPGVPKFQDEPQGPRLGTKAGSLFPPSCLLQVLSNHLGTKKEGAGDTHLLF